MCAGLWGDVTQGEVSAQAFWGELFRLRLKEKEELGRIRWG